MPCPAQPCPAPLYLAMFCPALPYPAPPCPALCCPDLPYPLTQVCAPQVKENEGLNFLCSKAEVIDELETTVPDWVKKRNPGWYPAYVHVLKVMIE